MKIDGSRARELVMEGAQLLDVRSAAEFAEGAAPGAMNIPLPMLGRYTGLLNRAVPIIVYCRSGHRSARAVELLASRGFGQVWDLGALHHYFHFEPA